MCRVHRITNRSTPEALDCRNIMVTSFHRLMGPELENQFVARGVRAQREARWYASRKRGQSTRKAEKMKK